MRLTCSASAPLVLFAVALGGCAPGGLRGAASDILTKPDKMEIYTIRSTMALRGPVPDGVEVFHGNQVLAKATVTDSGQQARIASVVDRGLDPSSPLAACFTPRHAVHAERGGHVVDLVICYECHAVKVIVDGGTPQTMPTNNARAALDVEFAKLGLTADPGR